jgi:CBS domain-containing protein
MPITAAEIMTRDVQTALPGTRLIEIARKLAARHISSVPICDAEGQLLGIITEGDIVRPLRESIRSKRAAWLLAFAEGEDLAPQFLEYIGSDNHTAGEFMSRNMITAGEDTTLGEIAELMIKNDIKRVPILREGKLVGIVSRSDLVAKVAKATPEEWLTG